MSNLHRKGIILAGGSGTRLYPATMAVSKQLLPVYDKPMIYYPLSTLMLAGIREIAIITTPADQPQFYNLLGNGSQWGLRLHWIIQPEPEGLAQAYILAEDFLAGAASAMILGDNIFFGDGLARLLTAATRDQQSTIFTHHVADPHRYGVISFDENGDACSIIEKPEKSVSHHAVTGLYFLDASAPARAKNITRSARGEYEITSLLKAYLKEDALQICRLGRGYAWLDAGTHASLLDAGNFVRSLQERQGLQTGSPEEVAFMAGWISAEQLGKIAKPMRHNLYGNYLLGLSKAKEVEGTTARQIYRI